MSLNLFPRGWRAAAEDAFAVSQDGVAVPTRWAESTPQVRIAVEHPRQVVEEAPPYIPSISRASLSGHTAEQLAVYEEAARAIGYDSVDLRVERLRAWLHKMDWPVYDLKTVVAHMDARAAAEGAKWGWEWNPLRERDRLARHSFGVSAAHALDIASRQDRPASDHYSGRPLYNKVVPLHALKKVAALEAALPGQVAFMVSDYAPAPEFKVDPFLMAVVENPLLHSGYGRFVIDVWDEPGFGLEEMLK